MRNPLRAEKASRRWRGALAANRRGELRAAASHCEHQVTSLPGWATMDLRKALVLARVVTPMLFMAHAAVRIYNGTIPRFAAFMESLGFPNGTAVVWAISVYELVAGLLVMLGIATRWCALGLAAIALGGIALIHARQGWFVGEHGTGGSEYSVSLLVLLLVIIAADRPAGVDPRRGHGPQVGTDD